MVSRILGVLVAAASIQLACGEVPQERPAPPERPSATTRPADTTRPGATTRPQQMPPRAPAKDTPATDAVLLTIKAALLPSEQQMSKINALYAKLREDQRAAMLAVRRERAREAPPTTVRPSPPATSQPSTSPAEPPATARSSLKDTILVKLVPINSEFIKQVRALLEPSQQEMWETVATAIDLSPPALREPGRGLTLDTGPKVGDVAPRFELKDLDGKAVSLQSLRGKPVVIEFGSYTCPIFRNKVEMIEKLRAEFGDGVQWVLIYGMEAHPTDGWVVPINTHAGIELPQHTSYEKRLECAKLAKDKLHLNVLVLVDTFENDVTQSYSGAPNRAYVVDSEGRVVSKQLWMDPQVTGDVLRGLASRPH